MTRILVVAGCLAAFAGLSWDAMVRLGEVYPMIDTCLADPARHVGKMVWIPPVRAIESGPEEFTISFRGEKARIRSTIQPPVGQHVMIYGEFLRDGTVRAVSCEVDPWMRAERIGVILVSAVILVIVGLSLRRTFVWRDGAIELR